MPGRTTRWRTFSRLPSPGRRTPISASAKGSPKLLRGRRQPSFFTWARSTNRVPPNKRLKLAGGDRSSGTGMLCRWQRRGCRPLPLRRRAVRPQLKRDPLGGHDFMGFPTSLVSRFEVQVPDSAVGPAAVLDYLQHAFASYDADITTRGEHFFEFRVSSASRFVREIRPPLTPRPWTPLSFVGSGSLTVTTKHDRVVVTVEVHTSRFLLLWSAVVLLLGGAFAPFTSVTGRFVIGA